MLVVLCAAVAEAQKAVEEAKAAVDFRRTDVVASPLADEVEIWQREAEGSLSPRKHQVQGYQSSH